MAYRHTPDMGQISGFAGQGEPMGDGYEECCQRMLETGVEWIMAHPGFEFAASQYQDVMGIIYADNEETKELMNRVVEASREEPDGPAEATGAQVHAVMLRLGFISKHGWEAYAKAMRDQEAGETESENAGDAGGDGVLGDQGRPEDQAQGDGDQPPAPRNRDDLPE